MARQASAPQNRAHAARLATPTLANLKRAKFLSCAGPWQVVRPLSVGTGRLAYLWRALGEHDIYVVRTLERSQVREYPGLWRRSGELRTGKNTRRLRLVSSAINCRGRGLE